MIRVRSWLVWSLITLCAALAGFWFARQLDSSSLKLASGTWLMQPRAVAPFSLVDHTGARFTDESLRGRPTLVFFGFTHCPDVCPTTLAKLAQVTKQVKPVDLRVLVVSVDPQRDSPAALSQYVRAFDPGFVGLTGEVAAIQKVANDFGVAVARADLPGGGYTVDHSAAVFLLDDAGRIVAVFTPPFDVSRMAQDLRRAAPHLSG